LPSITSAGVAAPAAATVAGFAAGESSPNVREYAASNIPVVRGKKSAGVSLFQYTVEFLLLFVAYSISLVIVTRFER